MALGIAACHVTGGQGEAGTWVLGHMYRTDRPYYVVRRSADGAHAGMLALPIEFSSRLFPHFYHLVRTKRSSAHFLLHSILSFLLQINTLPAEDLVAGRPVSSLSKHR